MATTAQSIRGDLLMYKLSETNRVIAKENLVPRLVDTQKTTQSERKTILDTKVYNRDLT